MLVGGVGFPIPGSYSQAIAASPSVSAIAKPTSLTSPQAKQLQQLFLQSVNDAFSHNKSPREIGQRLSKNIAGAMQNLGVPVSQQQGVIDGLNQIIDNGGTNDELQNNVQNYLSQAVAAMQQGLGGPAVTGGATVQPTISGAAPAGQLIDLFA